MKFKINREHFSNGLQQVLNVVSNRATMPILGNVLIQGEQDHLLLTTTNLDLGIRCKVKAEILSPGGVTLPVRKLAAIIKSLPDAAVEVSVASSNRAKITSGGSVFQLMGIAQDEFPALGALEDRSKFSIDQDGLKRMLQSVSYAQSSDENRHILNGVYFLFGDDKLTLVATDGRRLALISQELKVAEGHEGSLILPAKTVAELQRLLGQGMEVLMAFNERQVAFEIKISGAEDKSGVVDGIYLVSKIVEGTFPNYKQVIPKETENRIKVERELFADSVQRAAFMTSDKNHSVKLTISENLLQIQGQSAEFGESHESIAISYEGLQVMVAFNPTYLLEPLRALGYDEVYFEFKDELSPGVIKTLDAFQCVVMPLRLQ